MNETINIRLDERTMKEVGAIKEATGATVAQLVRTGLQKTISQFKQDGFLKIEAQPIPQKP